MRYIVDTNVWIDVSRGQLACSDVTAQPGRDVVLAPPVIIELMRGATRGGGQHFAADKSLFRCVTHLEILPLPKLFVSKLLWNVPSGTSGVLPQDYRNLIELFLRSTTFAQFLSETEKLGSIWRRMGELHSIHENVLEKELRSLEKLATNTSLAALPVLMATLYKCSGLLPDPEFFEQRFSAAVEFLRSSILQVRNRAKIRKNNRGMYVDSQLFFYLADPDLVLVTNEDFSSEIRESEQASRIISFEAFRKL